MRFLKASFLIVLLSSAATASVLRIESGTMLLGGTSYGTIDYQSYTRFDLDGTTRIPHRAYRMSALQPYSVYLGFPVRPGGTFTYRLQNPYGPQRLSLNGEAIFPVWYEECVWNFTAIVDTPAVVADSPEFTVVASPFVMSGSTVLFGQRYGGFKTIGRGTLQVQFEKIETKYYTRAMLFTFGDAPPTADFTY
jgi:hypothetical protein